jgi:hypothetical protein
MICLYSLTCSVTSTRFRLTSFLIYEARLAYFNVLSVSSIEVGAWEIQASITVRVLPPRDSFSNRVSFESR